MAVIRSLKKKLIESLPSASGRPARAIDFLMYLLPPKSSGLTLGPEDRMSAEFFAWLNGKFLAGQLLAIYFHVANEGKGKAAMARKRVIGLLPGAADWIIADPHVTILIELKAGKNTQNKNQVKFESLCRFVGMKYFCVSSVLEAQKIVEHYFIKKAPADQARA